MPEPRALLAIDSATTTNSTSWFLTSTGVAVDTQTITIGGIVFTTVTSIGVTAGNVLIGASAAATLTNLTALINAPGTTTSTGVQLSAANIDKLQRILGLTATTTATVMTLTTSKMTNINLTVSTTETNFAWTSANVSKSIPGISNGRASIQFMAASITSGNAVFTVDVSNDATNWTAYNRLTTNVTNTNAQTDTRVASVTLSSNGTSFVTIPDPCAFFRITATITTDGTYSATAYNI